MGVLLCKVLCVCVCVIDVIRGWSKGFSRASEDKSLHMGL